MTQLTIFQAIEAGQQGMTRAARKATQADPFFVAKAETAIIDYLRTHGTASSEDLTDAAIAAGAVAPDMRAFGAIYKRLSSRATIRFMGFCLRRRGNGTGGGRLWALNQ